MDWRYVETSSAGDRSSTPSDRWVCDCLSLHSVHPNLRRRYARSVVLCIPLFASHSHSRIAYCPPPSVEQLTNVAVIESVDRMGDRSELAEDCQSRAMKESQPVHRAAHALRSFLRYRTSTATTKRERRRSADDLRMACQDHIWKLQRRHTSHCKDSMRISDHAFLRTGDIHSEMFSRSPMCEATSSRTEVQKGHDEQRRSCRQQRRHADTDCDQLTPHNQFRSRMPHAST